MKEKVKISVVLGTFNRLRFLKKTIKNIREHKITVPYEIIVVDGGSTDGSLQWLRKQKDILTIIQHNSGSKYDGTSVERRSWGYFMNLGFKCSQGKFILMISDDCLLVPDTIMNAYQEINKAIGSGRKIGGMAFYYRNSPSKERRYRIQYLLDESKLMVNHGFFVSEALETIAWINENDYMFYYADGDLAMRLWQAGYEIIPCESAFVEHHVHSNLKNRSSNADYVDTDRNSFINKWVDDYSPGNNFGGSLFKEYDDKYNTVSEFPFMFDWLNLFLLKIINRFKRIKR